MYQRIPRNDDQAFDNYTSEESEKKTSLSLRNRCGLFQVKACLSRPKTWWLQTPAGEPRIRLKSPESEVAEDGT